MHSSYSFFSSSSSFLSFLFSFFSLPLSLFLFSCTAFLLSQIGPFNSSCPFVFFVLSCFPFLSFPFLSFPSSDSCLSTSLCRFFVFSSAFLCIIQLFLFSYPVSYWFCSVSLAEPIVCLLLSVSLYLISKSLRVVFNCNAHASGLFFDAITNSNSNETQHKGLKLRTEKQRSRGGESNENRKEA
jgi:hypothetical protein